MPSIDFSAAFQTLLNGVENLAKTTATNYANGAKNEGISILQNLKANLEKWTNQLAAGELTTADFQDLVKGQDNLMEMISLKQLGMAQIEIDKFKSGLLSLITTTVFSLLKVA